MHRSIPDRPLARVLAPTVALIAVLGQAAAEDPFLVAAVKSIDELYSDARRVMGLKPSDALPIDRFILQWTSGKGLAGVDRAKPLGLCMGLDAAGTPQFTVLVPVKDSKTFLGLFGVPPEAAPVGDGRTFLIQPAGRPVYARVSNGYSYLSTEALPLKSPPNPGSLSTGKYDVIFQVNHTRLSPALRELVIGKLESLLEAADSTRKITHVPDGAARQFLLAAREETRERTLSMFRDGDHFHMGLTLDASSGILALDWEAIARPGTPTAKMYSGFGARPSLFASLFSLDAAASISCNIPLPDNLRNAFGLYFASVFQNARAELQTARHFANTTDRESALESLDAFANAFAGLDELDFALVIDSGPGQKMQLVAALKVASGQELSRAFQRWSRFPPAMMDDVEFKFDVLGHAGARIHRLAPRQEYAGLPAGTPVHLAIRGDTLFFSMGTGSLGAMQSALDRTAAARERRPPVSVRVRPSKLLGLFPPRPDLVEPFRKAFSGSGDYATLEVIPARDGAKGRLTLGEGFLRLRTEALGSGAPGTANRR